MALLNPIAVRQTAYKELGFAKIANNLWRIIVVEDRTVVGKPYASRAELLADLTRYATEYGATLRTR